MKRLISITLTLILTLALVVTFAPTTVQAQGEPVVWSDPDLPSDTGYLHTLDTPFLANRFSGKSDHDMPAPAVVTLYDVGGNSLGTFSYFSMEGSLEWEESLPGYWLIGSYATDPHWVTINEFKLYFDPPNTPPVAMDDAYTTDEDSTLNVGAPGVLGNDDDANLDSLTAIKVTDPANGTLILNDDGSFTYNPAANFNGTDSFTYKANDGVADSNVATVTITINPLIIQVTVDINPNTLNLNSKGKWITAYIELPEGYNVVDIDVDTVLLNGTVPAEAKPTEIGDYDGDGITDLMVKFDRQDVIDELIDELDEWDWGTTYSDEITITLNLDDGTAAEGSDTIKILAKEDKGKGKK